MKIYRDPEADLTLLQGKTIAVIGYGNQGRAQALNLRDSGLDVVVGNRPDDYAERARQDGFGVHPIADAAALGDLVMLLIPDEVLPDVFASEIVPALREDAALVFASGYNVAFGQLTLPAHLDVVLLAPRMIGAGVRDLYVAGEGFPAFIGVAQDVSGRAKATVLALAKGIGSTRMGVVEVTFAQEAELDLFTEQCFGPAFGAVLTSAVNLLIDEGYPPEAVLLELYMSGEFAYTLGKIAEMGMVAQAQLHSTTSQYGSMSRGIRFQAPEIRAKMRQGLEEIRSGDFAREWAAEQAEGAPTLEMLRESAREMPLYQLERELREALGGTMSAAPLAGRIRHHQSAPPATTPAAFSLPEKGRLLRRLRARFRSLHQRKEATETARTRSDRPLRPLNGEQLEATLEAFLDAAGQDPALQAFAQGRDITTQYVVTDRDVAFTLAFSDGIVTGALGNPGEPAEVRLTLDAATLDGMLTGTLNPARAALSGDIVFGGDTRQALTIQRVQKDLVRLYCAARDAVTTHAAGADAAP